MRQMYDIQVNKTSSWWSWVVVVGGRFLKMV